MSPTSKTAPSTESLVLQAVGYPRPDLHHMTYLGGGTAPPAPCKWAANGRHHLLLAVAATAAAAAAVAAADPAAVNVAAVCLAAMTNSLPTAMNWSARGREGGPSHPPLHRVVERTAPERACGQEARQWQVPKWT